MVPPAVKHEELWGINFRKLSENPIKDGIKYPKIYDLSFNNAFYVMFGAQGKSLSSVAATILITTLH